MWHRLRGRRARPRLAADPGRRARGPRERASPRRRRGGSPHRRRGGRAAADPACARAGAVVRSGAGLPPGRERPRGDRERLRAGGHRARRLADGPGRPGCARRHRAREPAVDRAARPAAAVRALRPTRRRSVPIEPAAARRGSPGAYVASLSFRTVTYKALCAADQLGAFYPELRQGSLEVPFAIFHQRFSTNTSPSWERAQPFRLLCHNGEINAIDGNVRAMRGRGVEPGIAGVLEESGSDSSLLDNALELLVRGGRDVRHAASMLLPRAWQEDEELDRDVAAFHSYHAGLVEPWDGPAAIVFTDGRVVGAALDRNGLRPLRVATAGSFVACASEAGAVPLDPSARVRRSRLGPGELLAVDPGLGFEEDAAISRRLARSRPYRALARRRPPDGRAGSTPRSAGRRADAAPARRRLHARGHHAAAATERGRRPRAHVVDGRRHCAAAAGGPRPSRSSRTCGNDSPR